jgi:hypothetical protein
MPPSRSVCASTKDFDPHCRFGCEDDADADHRVIRTHSGSLPDRPARVEYSYTSVYAAPLKLLREVSARDTNKTMRGTAAPSCCPQGAFARAPISELR